MVINLNIKEDFIKHSKCIKETGVVITQQFTLSGKCVGAEPFGSGHIHDTFIVTCERESATTHYILQCINDHVFKEPQKVMENVERVTGHILHKMKDKGVGDIDRSCLQLVPSKDGNSYCLDKEGKYWRCFVYVKDAHTRDMVETEAYADTSLCHLAPLLVLTFTRAQMG